MKKLLITLTTTLVCVGAFAQGKIAFSTLSDHLVYFTSDTTKLNSADTTNAGHTVTTSLLGTLGVTLAADLYAGTSSSLLWKVTTMSTWAVAGRWTSASVNLPSTAPAGPFPAAVVTYFQVQVHDSRDVDTAASWLQIGHYAGETTVFQATPGPTAFASIANPIGVAPFSTWAAGTFQVTDLGAGNFGALAVYATTIPEPGTFAVAGLGMATLLIFRRRK